MNEINPYASPAETTQPKEHLTGVSTVAVDEVVVRREKERKIVGQTLYWFESVRDLLTAVSVLSVVSCIIVVTISLNRPIAQANPAPESNAETIGAAVLSLLLVGAFITVPSLLLRSVSYHARTFAQWGGEERLQKHLQAVARFWVYLAIIIPLGIVTGIVLGAVSL